MSLIYAIWGAGPRDRLGMVTTGANVSMQSMGVFEGDDIRVHRPGPRRSHGRGSPPSRERPRTWLDE